MLVVRIELWPVGDRSRSKEIGRVVIGNDGTGTEVAGNYDVALAHAESNSFRPGSWKGGKITGHRRSLSPYHIVLKAIEVALKGHRSKLSDALVAKSKEGEE